MMKRKLFYLKKTGSDAGQQQRLPDIPENILRTKTGSKKSFLESIQIRFLEQDIPKMTDILTALRFLIRLLKKCRQMAES